MSLENVLFAFGLTLLAGLATGVGSALAFFAKRLDRRFLAASLGFSAGVMIYVSFVEMFAKAKDHLISAHGERAGSWLTALALFRGLCPDRPHRQAGPVVREPARAARGGRRAGRRGGAKEPAPDGPFLGARHRHPQLPRRARDLHRRPAGPDAGGQRSPSPSPSTTSPRGSPSRCRSTTRPAAGKRPSGSRSCRGSASRSARSSATSCSAPLSERRCSASSSRLVAGIMVYISLDELLPTAEKYGEHHLAIYGLFAGMAVMAVSLLMFL